MLVSSASREFAAGWMDGGNATIFSCRTKFATTMAAFAAIVFMVATSSVPPRESISAKSGCSCASLAAAIAAYADRADARPAGDGAEVVVGAAIVVGDTVVVGDAVVVGDWVVVSAAAAAVVGTGDGFSPARTLDE